MLTVELLEVRAMLTAAPPLANPGILLLDPSGSGALTRSGDGSLVVTGGDIVVDSNNATAARVTGNGNVSAKNIYVDGKLSAVGTGRFLGTAHTGITPLADPLASLVQPAAPTTKFTNTVITNKTVTLSPGTYVNGITIGGNSNVMLLPGLYYVQAGGLNVSGTSKLTGTGVTIYNAAANSSAITFSGSTSVTLSAPTSGAFQGIVIFQNRTSKVPLTFGGGSLALTGEVYAAAAQVNFSGSSNRSVGGNGSTIPGAIIARDLNAGGNGSVTVGANSGGLSGDLAVSITDNVGGSSSAPSTGVATPGGQLVYTVTVTNNGPAAATGAMVSDTLPAGIASDTFTVSASGGAADVTHASSGSGNISDTVNLPFGGSLVYTITANVKSTATGSVVNTATISPPAGYSDSNPANNSASVTDAFGTDLAITNTDNVTSAVPGQSVTYTIVVMNDGPANVTGATVADLLSNISAIASDMFTVAATSGASDSTHAAGNTVFSGNINDTVNLNAGASLTYTVTAGIKSSATGSLANTATVASSVSVPDLNTANNSATDTDNLTPSASLSLTKSDGQSTATPGTQVTYTIVVSNTGPSDATNVVVPDTLPGALQNVTTPNLPNGVLYNNGTFTVGTLAAGASQTLEISGTIASSATGSLTNSAVGSASDASTVSATDTDTLTPEADLSITKTDSGGGSSVTATVGSVLPGGQLTYTITLTNNGPSDAMNVVVNDLPPAGLQDVTAPNPPAGTSYDSVTGVYAVGTLASGATDTFTISGTIAVNATGTLSNTAVASAGDADSISATDVDHVTPQADLSITKTDSDGGSSTTGAVGSAVPGNRLTYTIVVSNAGPSDATNVVVNDLPPAGLQDVTAPNPPAGTSYNSITGVFAIGTLASGASDTLTLSGTIAPSATGTLSNTAVASASDANAVSATDTDNLTPSASLALTKSDDQSTATPGTQVTYTIVVSNTGPSDATNVVVVDTLPRALQNVTAPNLPNGVLYNSGTFTVGTLPAGASQTLEISGTIASNATGSLTNRATASASDGTTIVSATDIDTLTPSASLSLTNTDNQASAVPGTQVTYTITLSNNGPSDATNVVVADTLPAALQNVTAPNLPAGVIYNPITGAFIVGTLAAGASQTLEISGTIASSATGILTNSASATASDATTFSATDTDTLTPQANLSITMTDNFGGSSITGAMGFLVSSDIIIYTITLSNTSANVATNVVVVDMPPLVVTSLSPGNLPAGIMFNSGNDTFSVFNLAAGASVTLVLNSNTIVLNGVGDFSNIISASASNANSVEAFVTDNVSN